MIATEGPFKMLVSATFDHSMVLLAGLRLLSPSVAPAGLRKKFHMNVFMFV